MRCCPASFAPAAHGAAVAYLGLLVVPLAGLWLPYVLVRDTARSTAPGRGVRVLVALWWVCFVLGLHRYVALPRMSPPVHVVATVLAALAWSRIVVVIQRSQTVTAAPSTVES